MKGPKNHDDAKASCAGAGGRLVELHSERKQDVVLYMERYLSQRGHSMDEPIIGASAIGIVYLSCAAGEPRVQNSVTELVLGCFRKVRFG